MLSIIIPVYNAESYLNECLDSIINNCTCDWEAILVNDGSQDNSGRICDSYVEKDKRFKVLHQENQGVSAARNEGLKAAQGEWISFVDADDKVLEGYTSLLNTQIDELETPDLIYFPHEGYKLNEFYSNNRKEIEKEILQLKCNKQNFEFFGYTWNKFFKSSIIREHNISFPVEQKHREDEYFTTEYCRYIKNLKVINQPLYSYRIDRSANHLTSRDIGPNELMMLANNMLKQLDVWTTKDLRSYELFRVARIMYDALRKTANPMKQWPIGKQIVSLAKAHKKEIDKTQLPHMLTKHWDNTFSLVFWINYMKLCQKF